MAFSELPGEAGERLSTGSLEEQRNLKLDLEKMGELSHVVDSSPQKLSIFQASLAVVAANIGIGILGLSYAIY